MKFKKFVGIGAAATLLAGTATLMGGGTANAATQVGGLAVNPGTDTTTSNALTFTTEAACPAPATNAIVRLVGSGITQSKSNLMGNTSLSLATPSGNGFTLPAQNTFNQVFTNNGVVSPNGTYQIVLLCVDGPGATDFGDYVGNVTFTHGSSDPVFEASYTSSVPAHVTTTSVTVPSSPTTFGGSATFNATVSGATGGGTVQFKDGGVNLGTPQALTAGASSFTTSALSAGSHSITASFIPADSTVDAASTSAAQPFTVNAASTSVAITGAGTSQQFDAATFTANTPAGVAGSVQFKIDGSNVGSATPVSGGTASYSTTTLAPGAHTVDATFTPTSSNYLPSNAPQVTHTVTAFAGKTTSEQINAQVAAGALTISVEGDAIVNLHAPGDPTNPNAVMNAGGDLLQAEGDLDTVVITDTRAGDPGWNATGSVSDFVNGSNSVSGFNLGWTPAIVSSAVNQVGITAGANVDPAAQPAAGTTPSDPTLGLGVPRQFAHTFDNSGNGTAKIGAHLKLNIPTDVPAGTYSATITFTVL